jgi:hypothetical protein
VQVPEIRHQVLPIGLPPHLTRSIRHCVQNSVWSDNVYSGPSTFYAWNQGNADNPVSRTRWTGSLTCGDKCSSAQERKSGFCAGPFGQDAGSTYRSAPPG